MAISLSALVHPGVEALAGEEVKEILGVKSSISKAGVTFNAKSKEDVLRYLAHAQLPRRVVLTLGIFSKAEDIALPKFHWKDIFISGWSYALEFEHISELEIRQQLAKKINEHLGTAVKTSCGFSPAHQFKKPDIIVILHFTGKEYVLGIDLAGEMQKRAHRIFTHHASFTGDLGYFLVRSSGFTPGEKLLVGWVKDGTLAIEAALFAYQLPVHRGIFPCEKFPLFQETSKRALLPQSPQKPSEVKVFAFDVSLQNITAARKNAKLAGVYELIDFQKYSLEELDVKYGETAFDRIIFHLTIKDEPKLNELYYQMKYILKPKGTVLLVTRKQLDLPVPEGFTLISQEELKRGESVQRIWVMKKE